MKSIADILRLLQHS